jgi:hypothetical protein
MSFTTGIFSQQAQNVLNDSRVLEKENTNRAYDGKAREFEEFCESVFSSLPDHCRKTVTEEKLFGFLYYQSFRQQRSRGIKRNSQGSSRQTFDIYDYNEVMNHPNRLSQLDTEEETVQTNLDS